MAKRSNRVDAAIKECWAKLAKEGVTLALNEAKNDRLAHAEGTMAYVERWLTKAGADATRTYFSVSR